MNWARARELIECVAFQLTRWRRPRRRPGTDLLILYMNLALDQTGLVLPPGCALTTDKWLYRDADAVVFHIPTLTLLHRIPKQPGQLWVAASLECEENYPQLRDPQFMSQFDLTMTYRLDADLPTPYLTYFPTPDLVPALRRPARLKAPDKLAALFISSRHDRSGRLHYARELMRHLDVHSYGRRLNNRRLAHDTWRPSKIETIANYKFTFAFENACSIDYVTEKFFDPLVAGSVPVYLGAPNVDDFAPGDHCFINVADFRGPRELAEHLTALAVDERRYAEYFAWKDRPFRAQFAQLLETVQVHPIARLAWRVMEAAGERGSPALTN